MTNEQKLTVAERNLLSRFNDCNTPVTPGDRNLLLKMIERLQSTIDRDTVLEECAKVCDDLSQGFDENAQRQTRVIAAAMQGALTCAAALRSLKNNNKLV